LAVRIYSLAQELSIDAKELVEVCNRAGVTGKGSALASLSDDEVARVKEFLAPKPAGGSPAATPSSAVPAAPERPTGEVRGKLRTIVATRPTRPAAGRPAAGRGEEAPADDVVDSTPAPPAPIAAEADAAALDDTRKSSLSAPGPLARMMRGDTHAGPAPISGGKVPVVGARPEAPRRKANEGPKARPVVKLAAMPTIAEPRDTKPKADEGPTQKPDMKLPAEVLGGARGGAKPLAAHLKRAEKTLEAARLRDRTAVPEEPGRPTGVAGKGRAKGKAGAASTGEGPMLGGREARQLNRTRGGRAPLKPRRMLRRAKKSGANTAAPRKERVAVQLPCTVKELSEAAGVPAAMILRILLEEGVMTTINAQMDLELTELVAAELGVDVDFLQPESLEDRVLSAIDDQDDEEEDLRPRAPVVTFLGHVDHGKTSLLDKLIGINVASGESGGITQHIRAYQIEKDGRPISFVDTPGHEAFTEMRARGAGVTDIVVLVVAADDGVMPQTEEAISHAKAAEVPIIVALNKIDLPGVDPMKTLTGLSRNELQPSEWGGEVEVVKTSATTGAGLDELLETILTIAELNEYRANPGRPGMGSCLESQQDADRGVVTKLIVQNGTLRVGDVVVCGDAHGRIKAMYDPLHPRVRLQEALPSMPVNVTGLDVAPSGGERFYVLDDIAEAREIAANRANFQRAEYLGTTGFQQTTLDTLFERLEGAEEVQTLNLIVRADVRGSIEAIEKELSKLEHPEVRLRILQRSVGAVTEGDIVLAHASQAVVIAFNVTPDEKARAKADQLGVEVRRYSIIYKIADDLKAAMEGMLKPEQREVELGRVLVQMVFKISRIGSIAGCRVLQGVVERNARARVIRDNTVIGDYAIDTLRREKDDAKEVREGYECGIKLAGFNDVKEADLLEVYKVEEISRKFDD
jgi:translation initiation factor IF-2